MKFEEKDAVIFNLKSIKLKYEFESQNIPDEKIEVISHSRIYKFSTNAIERHVLHDKYSCDVVVFTAPGKLYNMRMLFFIPHFQKKTEFKFGFFDTFFPPNDIIKIFNNNFHCNSNLNSTQQALLRDLQ